MPAPAPDCTSTRWPRATYSRTAPGVRPTRYSWVLISVGTPTSMDNLRKKLMQCRAKKRNLAANIARLPDENATLAGKTEFFRRKKLIHGIGHGTAACLGIRRPAQ